MVRASVEPPWLHTIGQIAGTMLVLELLLALSIMLALAVALAFGLWWLREHIVPFIEQYGEQAQQILARTTQGSDRVVAGVAEFHGRRQEIQTMLRVLLFGRQSAAQGARAMAPVATTRRAEGQSAGRGVRQPRGASALEGYAPRDLSGEPASGTGDPDVDLAPLNEPR